MAPSMPTSHGKSSLGTPASKVEGLEEAFLKKDTNDRNVVHHRSLDNDDTISVASSLSSTPLISLKKNKVAKKKKPPSNTTATKTKTSKSSSATTRKKDAKKASTLSNTAKKTKKPVTAKKQSQQGKSVTGPTSATNKKKKPTSTPTTKKVAAAPWKKEPSSTTSTVKPAKQAQKTASTKPTIMNDPIPHKIVASRPEKDDDDDEEEEEVCCCLCFCGVDCSDRALFFPKDRQQEIDEMKDDDDDEDEDKQQPYYFTMDDPYLDESLYDKNNALVYCDSCNRLYHQKCHFVPLLTLPRGDWSCLICTSTASISNHDPTMPTPSGQLVSTITPPPSKKEQNKKGKAGDSTNKKKRKSQSLPPPVLKPFVLEEDSRDLLYSAPKTLTAKELEHLWEVQTGPWKAHLWYQQLKQLKTFLNSQASNIRMATAALETIASTKKNRQHFTKSQELKQTLLRMTTSKWKIREALMSLESIRTKANTTLCRKTITLPPLPAIAAGEDGDEKERAKPPPHPSVPSASLTRLSLLEDWSRKYPQHAHHIFPFGHKMHKEHSRIIPRTREMILAEEAKAKKECRAVEVVPSEILVPSPNSKKRMKHLKDAADAMPAPPVAVTSTTNSTPTPNAKTENNDDNNSDNDSGITLDDLKCCVCMIGDASDENDVLLCDGQGCYRAYHMKCVYPEIKPEDIANEEEDWFCPLCSAIDNCVVQTQLNCCGEDWEHRRIEAQEAGIDIDDTSLKSWERVADVFPTSKWEFETAERFKRGRQSEEIQTLLAVYLGEEFAPTTAAMPIGSDSEDEEDYSLFDEESFNERRQKERENERGEEEDDDASSSTNSSAATLVDMSSVELEIGKDELAALTDEEDSDMDDEDDDDDNSNDGSENSSPRKRISKRLRNKDRAALQSEQSSFLDRNGADFSDKNIVEGKRRRKKIDYRKLNDALFGQLTAEEKAEIDDTADFKIKKKNAKGKRKASSSEEKEPARKRLKKSKQAKEEEQKEEEEEEEVQSSDDGENDSNDGDQNSDDSSDDMSDQGSADDGSESDENSSGDEDNSSTRSAATDEPNKPPPSNKRQGTKNGKQKAAAKK